MKVAIIGAGWFGCHLAVQLKKIGFQPTIFEQSADFFSGASGFNTSKLHQGFHYPRSMETRIQAKLNFDRFLDIYPTTIVDTESYYAIASEHSLLDFETYTSILDASELNYSIVENEQLAIQHIEGIIKTAEKNIDIGAAKALFSSELKDNIRFNSQIDHIHQTNNDVTLLGETFDFCINTTNNHLASFREDEVIYEQIVLPLYRPINSILEDTSIVVMDGPFVSINPFIKEQTTLVSTYHVAHSILNSSRSKCKFEPASEAKISEAIQNIEKNVSYFYPNFKKETEFDSYLLSNRTKNNDASANRECFTNKEGRVIHVFSGKISSIFTAEDIITKWLQESIA